MNTPHLRTIVPACLLLGGFVGLTPAAETVSPANLFPSPTGIYRNESAANVIYGATIQLAFQQCHEPDRSVKPPTSSDPGTYVPCSCSHFLVVGGGGAGTPPVVVPVTTEFHITPDAVGGPGAYGIEVLAFTATGLPGGLMIRESPTLQSTGHHKVRQVPSGNWYVESFFDVFTEVSADGGATWIPGDIPVRFDLSEPGLLVSTENQLPPAGTVLATQSTLSYPGSVRIKDLELVTPSAYITTLPLRGTLCDASDRGVAKGKISLDGGTTFNSFTCNYTANRKYQAKARVAEGKLSASFFDAEIMALELTGGTLPAGMKIRESPTKASTGRCASRLAADGLHRISSFFDVFTELSTDGGATWNPNDGFPCYIVNSHATPGVDVAAFVLNPSATPSSAPCTVSTRHLPHLMTRFKNGDIPTQEDLIEYPDGTIIRGLDLRLPSAAMVPPAPGTTQTQALDITLQCEVSTDGGVTYEPVRDFASANLRVSAVAVGAGAGASPVMYETEWLSLDFTTTLKSGTTMLLRESPIRASTGKTSIRAASDGTYLAMSFFDIFTELSYNGGTTWSVGPVKWMAPETIGRERIRPIADYPPDDTALLADGEIADAGGTVLRRVRIHAIHNGSELPPPSSGKNFTFTTTASGEISTDGGTTFRYWSGQCIGTIHLTSDFDCDDDGDGTDDRRFFSGELLQLDLSGPGLDGIRLRESPTKASLGRTSVRTTPDSSFGICGFFDVFTDISLDGGTTWTPATGLPVTLTFDDSPGEHFQPTTSLPPDAVMEMPAADVVDLGSDRYMRKVCVWLDTSAARCPPPAPGESVDLDLDGTMDCEVSTDGGLTYAPVHTTVICGAIATAKKGKRSEAELNLRAISISGELSAGGIVIHIRESPTLPSRGQMRLRESPTRHTLRESPTRSSLRAVAGGSLLEGFFDVFIETSEDGLVWSPRSNLLRLGFQPAVSQDNSFATNAFPPRDSVFETNTGAPPVHYWNQPMLRDMVLENFAKSSPLSGPGTQTVSCTFSCEASTDGGLTWAETQGTGEITVMSTPVGTTGTHDQEVLALDITTPAFQLRESPTQASTGRTSIRVKPPTAEGNSYLIDSFFDIFTELSSDGGTTWTPAGNACRLLAHRMALEVVCNSDWQPVPNQRLTGDPDFDLLFEGTSASISGVTLDAISVVSGTTPPPAPGAKTKRQCMFHLGLKGRSEAAAPPTSARMKVEVGWECSGASASSTRRVLLNEITSMNVCGETMPGGMMLRESPTRASLGRTSIRIVPGGHQICSFFDIFTELSLDGGQTWHAAITPLCLEMIDAGPEHLFPASNDPLPPVGFVARPGENLPRFFETGDKPTQVEFHDLIDSTIHRVDDREFIGLRHYDASIAYLVGDSTVVNRHRGTITFGYILWKHPDSTDSWSAYDLEVTTLEMSGGTMPSGMQLRGGPRLKYKPNISSNRQPDGSSLVRSSFDVILEMSLDGGANWKASDLPLHFVQQDRVLPALVHSDHFAPQGINYVQRSTPVRCADGTCASGICEFTSPPAPLPGVPGTSQIFPLAGHFSASFTPIGGSPTSISADLDASVNVTLVETVGGTRYFDMEMLGLQLTGSVTPAPFRLRESPTKASLGRHIVTDTGDGDFRITSFFDIWTEISSDGGQTWAACDVPLRLELAAPEISVAAGPDPDLTSHVSIINMGPVLSGASVTRTVTVHNTGSTSLDNLAVSMGGVHAGDFTASGGAPTLAPGESTNVTIQFTAGSAGTRNATLIIASNDSDENPFQLALTARALAPGGDDDGDGLTNEQETTIQGNPLYSDGDSGFNPLASDDERLTLLRDNGLYLDTDMHSLALGRPVLQRDAVTGKFVLRIGVQQSPDLSPPWTPLLDFTPSYDPATGHIDLEFSPPAGAPASFYRVFGTEP